MMIREFSPVWPADKVAVDASFKAATEEAQKRAGFEGATIDWEAIDGLKGLSRYFLAEAIDDRFLGIIGVRMIPFWLGATLLIDHLYVSPGARRCGRVFRALVAEAEAWGRTHGARFLLGNTWPGRARPRKSLSRMGATLMGATYLKRLGAETEA